MGRARGTPMPPQWWLDAIELDLKARSLEEMTASVCAPPQVEKLASAPASDLIRQLGDISVLRSPPLLKKIPNP